MQNLKVQKGKWACFGRKMQPVVFRGSWPILRQIGQDPLIFTHKSCLKLVLLLYVAMALIYSFYKEKIIFEQKK